MNALASRPHHGRDARPGSPSPPRCRRPADRPAAELYFSAAGEGGADALSGWRGMAFSISARPCSRSCRHVRSINGWLSGYRPIEPSPREVAALPRPWLVIAAGFATLMWAVSHPERPWLLFLGSRWWRSSRCRSVSRSVAGAERARGNACAHRRRRLAARRRAPTRSSRRSSVLRPRQLIDASAHGQERSPGRCPHDCVCLRPLVLAWLFV
jgi:hypothetical protein